MSFKLFEEKMNLLPYYLKKMRKIKKLLNMLINPTSTEIIIIKACMSTRDIESYCSFVDEIFQSLLIYLFNKHQIKLTSELSHLYPQYI